MTRDVWKVNETTNEALRLIQRRFPFVFPDKREPTEEDVMELVVATYLYDVLQKMNWGLGSPEEKEEIWNLPIMQSVREEREGRERE